ncbi:hypothetical protein D3C78_1526900 [compost metagenome]
MKAQAAASGATATKEQIAAMTQQVTQKALLDGINYTFLIATVVTAVALVLSFFLKRSKTAMTAVKSE